MNRFCITASLLFQLTIFINILGITEGNKERVDLEILRHTFNLDRQHIACVLDYAGNISKHLQNNSSENRICFKIKGILARNHICKFLFFLFDQGLINMDNQSQHLGYCLKCFKSVNKKDVYLSFQTIMNIFLSLVSKLQIQVCIAFDIQGVLISELFFPLCNKSNNFCWRFAQSFSFYRPLAALMDIQSYIGF